MGWMLIAHFRLTDTRVCVTMEWTIVKASDGYINTISFQLLPSDSKWQFREVAFSDEKAKWHIAGVKGHVRVILDQTEVKLLRCHIHYLLKITHLLSTEDDTFVIYWRQHVCYPLKMTRCLLKKTNLPLTEGDTLIIY